MNIRVDLNTPINDGTEVVFRSPVDCSQITGLIVYYNGESKEFALADAHGNNVGDIDHLFAENVVVKVILDVTTSMAFVQNADTNAYLEWRFQDTIDKCCPHFKESGSVVRCEPVEGYPLKVVTETEGGINSITLTQCGKNLFDKRKYAFTGGYANYNTGVLYSSDDSPYCRIDGYIPVSHLRGKTITISPAVGGANPGVAFYKDASVGSFVGGFKNSGTVPEEAVFMVFSVQKDKGSNIQVELGSAATEFEEYCGLTYTAIPTEKTYEWSNIKAMSGINTIWSSVGTTSVEGKSNPASIIEKLTKAIISLGGNV